MKTITKILIFLSIAISFGQDTQKARDYVKAGLIEMGMENVEVKIMPIPSYLKGLIKGHGDELEGFIRGGGDQYILYIKDLKNGSLLRVIAHELIHLKQMREQRLTTTSDNIVFFNGEKYNGKNMSYDLKPWETEARNDGDKLRFKIKSIIKNQSL